MTANLDINNDLISNPVSLASVKIPSATGSLQGRHIINTTDEVNTIRREFEEMHRPQWRQQLAVGVVLCIAGVVGIVTAAIFAPYFLGAGISFILLGGGFVAGALSLNKEKQIAMTKNKDFLVWAEQQKHKLNVSNIEKHYSNFVLVKRKLQEDMWHETIRQLPVETRIAMHEAEMSRFRVRYSGSMHA